MLISKTTRIHPFFCITPILLWILYQIKTNSLIVNAMTSNILDSSSHAGYDSNIHSHLDDVDISNKQTITAPNDHVQSIENSNSLNYHQRFVFSDVDGTLVHYHHVDHQNTSSLVLFLPPSSTGLQAHISIQTLRQCQQLRKKLGIKLILVSGMRTKTLFQRLPYLPRADAYASENGGRIFYPISLEEEGTEDWRTQVNVNPSGSLSIDEYRSSNLLSQSFLPTPGVLLHMVDNSKTAEDTITSSMDDRSDTILRVKPVEWDGMSLEDMQEFGIVEDLVWRKYIHQTDVNTHMDPSQGLSNPKFQTIGNNDHEVDLLSSLQILAKILEDRNVIVDKFEYSTCIRVNWKQQRQDLISREDFDEIQSSVGLDRLGLQCSINLGCIDFFPIQSGKKNCCVYLAKKMYKDEMGIGKEESLISGIDILASSSICICDDDNDIPLALACQKAFLPTISSESIKSLIERRGEQIVVTEDIPKGIVGFLATEEALRRVIQEFQTHEDVNLNTSID